MKTSKLILLLIIITPLRLKAENIHCNNKINLPSIEIQQLADHFTCSSLKKLYDEYILFKDSISFPIRNDLLREKLNRKEAELQLTTKSCQDQRFQFCYPNLNPSITKEKLDTLFSDWIQDQRFRYLTGGGACEVRAKGLAYELANLGYEAKQIRITQAPTLIAMERDSENELNGNFYDYGGNHSLVQIMVKEGNTIVPYLLDPQFMNYPVPRDQYFTETIGQTCKKISNIDPMVVRSYLNCYYSERTQNSSMENISPYEALNKESMACGWHFDIENIESFAHSVGKQPSQPNIDRKLNLLNRGVSNSENFTEEVSEESSKKLILARYENLDQKILERIEYYEKQITLLEESVLRFPNSQFYSTEEIESYKKIVLQLKEDLLGTEGKLEEVKSNLNIEN